MGLGCPFVLLTIWLAPEIRFAELRTSRPSRLKEDSRGWSPNGFRAVCTQRALERHIPLIAA